MPYFSENPSIWPWPNIGRPGRVLIKVQMPKYLSPSPNCSIAVRSSGLFMKLTKRFKISGSNSRVFFIVNRYLAFSSSRSMFIKALLYTRCMPSVRTKKPSIIQKASANNKVSGTSWATRSTTSRQNSSGNASLNCPVLMPCSLREGMAPPVPGIGNHNRW